jgi:hypothetical protein
MLETLVAMLGTVMKNREETGRSYIQCGPFSKQQITLKRSSLEKLDSALAAWFKQAHERNASIDGTHLREKALHVGLSGFQWMGRQI